MNEYRTNTCGELRINDVEKEVKLAGWVSKIRNLGGMTFIDLRDEFGITQIVVQNNEEMCKDIVTESCISVEGKVIERTSKNDKMETRRN